MNAHKLFITQVLLELRQRPTQDVSVAAHMQAGVIARSLDPVDVRDTHEQHLAPASDYESLWGSRLRRQVVGEPFLGTLQGTTEARVVERLQQVIERSRLEGAQRIFVVGRHEDDGRRQIVAQQLEYVEAAAFGHLHIEKHQVRLRFSDLLNGIQAGRTFGDGSNVWITVQQHG